MKHTIVQIEAEIRAVGDCLISLPLLEVGDEVYTNVLKALRILDYRLRSTQLEHLSEAQEAERNNIGTRIWNK